MAKNFSVETAYDIVKKKSVNVENITNSQISSIYKDYFSLEDGKPVTLETISNRVKKRLNQMDRLTGLLCIDLFFIHSNWNTFYDRKDSFSTYIKEELKISRTHAYGILNSVSLLKNFYTNKNLKLEDFLDDISEAINNIGIKKLIVISKLKDDKKRFGLVNRLLNGETISSDDLIEIVESRNERELNIKVVNNTLIYMNKEILEFNIDDEDLRKCVITSLKKFYRRKKLKQ